VIRTFCKGEQMHVSIISVGSEVVSGMITDTNATFASQNLFDRGYEILFHHAIGDHQESFAQLLNSLKTPINIVGGGLGPTFDDVTRNSAAQAFQSPLQFHPELWEDLKARYSKIKDSNQVQCYLPQKAKILPNLYGTAPGFYLEDHGRYYFFLPGVPREFTKMFSEQVLPRLSECGDPPPYRETKFFKVIGYTESSLNEHLRSIIDPEIFNGIFAGEGCITLKFVTTGDPVVAKKTLSGTRKFAPKDFRNSYFFYRPSSDLSPSRCGITPRKKSYARYCRILYRWPPCRRNHSGFGSLPDFFGRNRFL
jgi:molybdenum cofactor synthesis domain-containing protein